MVKFRSLIFGICLVIIVNGYGFEEFQRLQASDRQKSSQPGAGHPIVLVPGFGASQIEAKLTGKANRPHLFCARKTSDFFDLWLNLPQLTTPALHCFVDNMRLVFNATTGFSENSPGVETRIPDAVENVEFVDKSKIQKSAYFSHIIENLVKWGYRRELDIIAAPYDWRRAPHELRDFYAMLRTKIEMTFLYNGNKKVVVLGHSMGNAVLHYFYTNMVSQAWKDIHIKSHVSLGAPWGGSVQIVRLYTTGYNLNNFRFILAPNTLRPMERSFTSSAFLFPSKYVWNYSEVFAQNDEKNYTVANIEEFFRDIEYPLGMAQYKATRYPKVETLDHPGVAVNCLYGTQVSTPERLVWKSGLFGKNFPDSPPATVYGDGDGTVNIKSLEVCKRWKQSKAYGLEGADHMSIMKDQRTVDLLKGILY